MSASWIFFSTSLLAILILTFKSNNAYIFNMTKAVCESYNKSWVVINDCSVRVINRNKTTLTVIVNITEPVNDLTARFRVLKKANGYKPWLMDYTFYVCQIMRKNNHPMATIILNAIKGLSTLNHSCPFVGINGLKDFYRPENLLIALPTGDYLMSTTWMFYKKLTVLTNVFFTFVDEF